MGFLKDLFRKKEKSTQPYAPVKPKQEEFVYSHADSKETISSGGHHVQGALYEEKEKSTQSYAPVKPKQEELVYSHADSHETIYTGGHHVQGALYEKVEICRYRGRWYYVTFSMTDRMNAGGSDGIVPPDCFVDGKIDKKKLLTYVANREKYMELLIADMRKAHAESLATVVNEIYRQA